MPEDDRLEAVTVTTADGVALAGWLARPPGLSRALGMVLCHGFPTGTGGASAASKTYPELAGWLSRETGWAVLTINFRGTGESGGDFSVEGWLADIDAAVTWIEERPDVAGTWLAGSATGGALCVVHAAGDERVRGVATMAAPASLRSWVDNVPRFLEFAREQGVIKTPGFPADPLAWARQIADLDPLTAAGKIPPRPFLVLHGAADESVPPSDSELYTLAAGAETEHRVLAGAGHRLRHDPRACALLAGWMSRQES